METDKAWILYRSIVSPTRHPPALIFLSLTSYDLFPNSYRLLLQPTRSCSQHRKDHLDRPLLYKELHTPLLGILGQDRRVLDPPTGGVGVVEPFHQDVGRVESGYR